MQIAADTLDDLLRKVFQKLLRSQMVVKATRGSSRELLGVGIKLRQPRARLSHTERKGRVFSALGELLWYLKKTDSLRFIEYYLPNYGADNSEDGKTIYGAYGPRLFNRLGINQVENVLGLLRRKPTSRRAVIQLFDARDIDQTRIEVPCTCTLQFLQRNGKLDLVVCMRSNDAYLGFSHDVFAFTMLQEIVATTLGFSLGTYHHFVGSLHLYDCHQENAIDYLEEGWQPIADAEMPPMPEGDPWPSIKQLLIVESRLRKGKALDLSNNDLAPYWQDVARLLAIFAASKNNETKKIRTIRSEMSSGVFDEYVEQREEQARRRQRDGQMSLGFQQPSRERTVVPRWLNQLTKSLTLSRTHSNDVENEIIPWACPAPFFGDIVSASIATVAVNPSDREFCDASGRVLPDAERRLETLDSLDIERWGSAKPRHHKAINISALHYFCRNPYGMWFRDLERLLEAADASYYETRGISAAHLDLVPYATRKKWASLTSKQRTSLLILNANCLADLLKESQVSILVLNGSTVAKQLEKLAGKKFSRTRFDEWKLVRRTGTHVDGIGMHGIVSSIGGTDLGRQIAVVGYNHNLQSSYGVTNAVKDSIGAWVAEHISEALNES